MLCSHVRCLWKKISDNKMTELNSEKWKNSFFLAKKYSFIGSASGRTLKRNHFALAQWVGFKVSIHEHLQLVG